MEHHELVQEMPSIERMATQDRLKHARKRRLQQLKKWGQYEKHLEKDSSKKRRKQDSQRGDKDSELLSGKPRRRRGDRIKFVANVALLESAARNDLEEVRRLLGENVSPDVTNEDGLTALHQCCIDDNEEMLKLLLEFGANVNACDSEMWTPLHAAATCGHVTLCKHLIDRGAELLSVNADGNMPYDICEDEVTLDYIETEMAKRGITQEQIDDTRLTTERQMLSDLKGLAGSGGDLEIQDVTSGASMLHVAAANGYYEVADFLLDNHVNVDSRDVESWQPIHAAAYWGQLEILEMLVQNGADLDSKTKNGETAFDLCEDPDIKQKILDMKDEIETNKASRHRPGSSRKHKQTSRNTSMRRSSIRGEKSSLFKKEAHEEALHFGLRLIQDDDDELAEVDEEKELPATNIDDVTISIEDMDGDNRQAVSWSAGDSRSEPYTSSQKTPESNNISHNATRPTPAPRSLDKGSLSSKPNNDLRDLDREKDDKKQTLDAHFNDMFLESLPNNNNRRSGQGPPLNATQPPRRQFYPPPMMEKKNGHNNNNNATTMATTTGPAHPEGSTNLGRQSSYRDGQLRRFVAPPSAPVVGAENDDKNNCCVIL